MPCSESPKLVPRGEDYNRLQSTRLGHYQDKDITPRFDKSIDLERYVLLFLLKTSAFLFYKFGDSYIFLLCQAPTKHTCAFCCNQQFLTNLMFFNFNMI